MVEVITEIRIPEMTIECNANLKIEKKEAEFKVGSILGTLAMKGDWFGSKRLNA